MGSWIETKLCVSNGLNYHILVKVRVVKLPKSICRITIDSYVFCDLNRVMALNRTH